MRCRAREPATNAARRLGHEQRRHEEGVGRQFEYSGLTVLVGAAHGETGLDDRVEVGGIEAEVAVVALSRRGAPVGLRRDRVVSQADDHGLASQRAGQRRDEQRRGVLGVLGVSEPDHVAGVFQHDAPY